MAVCVGARAELLMSACTVVYRMQRFMVGRSRCKLAYIVISLLLGESFAAWSAVGYRLLSCVRTVTGHECELRR